MKILFIIDTLEIGGAEKSILDMASRLKSAKPVIVVLYRGLRLLPEYERAGLRVITLNLPGKYNFIKAIKAFTKIVKTERPDLVHATLFRSEIVARIGLRNSSIPLISSFVSDSYSAERYGKLSVAGRLKLDLVKWIDGVTAQWSTHFVSISRSIVSVNCKALKISPNRVTVIYRGRDVSLAYSISEARRNQLAQQFGGNVTFFSVGRLLVLKGFLESIEAFSKVIKLHPEARYLIAGEGHDRTLFQMAIDKYGLNGKVFLLGTRNDIPELLAYSDVFVFPSHYEGLGGALVEAMLATKPIVASDIEVIAEFFVHGKTGLLFQLKNPDDLAKKMVWMIEHPEEAKAMGIRARETAVQRFNIENVVRQHEELYARILKEKKKTR
ncbi:MAG: hypothetical protein KatS3mg032_0008 [Cyclobacteriaceae bacterium]|nr:MAG: hypothetical protein KatS3mg032_0008 [Cyclobacteriaceae bacterium]